MTDLGRLWQCQMDYCGYVYDPERGDPSRGIEPGTDFRDLPEDWSCPLCGVKAYTFRPLEGPGSALFENIKTMPEHADKSADEIMLGIQEGTLVIDPYYAASGKQEHGDAVTGKSSVVREGAG